MEASFMTPAGHWIRMEVRDGTSDWNTCNAITKVGDEYHLPRGQDGWGLDVGAHIGAWTIALLADNPGMRCIAIEALPENVALLNRNLDINGLAHRAVVLNAGAAAERAPVEVRYSEDPHHRFIGSQGGTGELLRVPGVTLEDVIALVEAGQGDSVAFAKIDCEGCEYSFLASPAIGRVRRIDGEVHFGSERLRELLMRTHVVTFPAYVENPDFGPFVAELHPALQ